MDLTVRYFQFFDHYLRGAPAPSWMSSETPYLAKDNARDPIYVTQSAAVIP